MYKLVKKIKINTTIELITGLHIGGSSDNVEIGGIDNPVIKIATKDNQPYIPGSSLKGKMRCPMIQRILHHQKLLSAMLFSHNCQSKT